MKKKPSKETDAALLRLIARQLKAKKHGRRIKAEQELNKIGLSLLHSPFRKAAELQATIDQVTGGAK